MDGPGCRRALALDGLYGIAAEIVEDAEHVLGVGIGSQLRVDIDLPRDASAGQAEALPELTSAANELAMTCFLAVLDADEIVTLTSVEPRHAVASVAQRPGSRHPMGIGAPGKVILASLPASEWPETTDAARRAELEEVRVRGWAISHDEVLPGVRSTAVPLKLPSGQPAALAVVYVSSSRADEEIAARLASASTSIREALGG